MADKASDVEVAKYKQFIYDCGAAVPVPVASEEGLFGLSSNKVSAAAVAALAKFKVALKI